MKNLITNIDGKKYKRIKKIKIRRFFPRYEGFLRNINMWTFGN